MNNEHKRIQWDLKQIQNDLESAQRGAASLISSVIYDTDKELKDDADYYKKILSQKAVTLFTKITNLIDDELDDVQKNYMMATYEPKNDNDNN